MKLSIIGYLAYSLQLKFGAKVTLMCIKDIQDCFINVQFGFAKYFKFKRDGIQVCMKVVSLGNIERTNI